MIKYLAALLLCLSSTAIAQTVDTTGNIVDPTKWNNVIYMNAGQLGQVEGEGGGPTPAFNTDTNTIRFSFMPYTVSQIIAINSVLSGQGISVSGFNYSWKIYNDLQNCCSTRGSLFVNGSLTDKSGKVVESYFYDYSLTDTGPTFQTITGTETFKSPYQLNSLGDISISWTGNDINFWSGYYGPRVRDTSLTLNYSVKQSTPTIPTTNTNTTSTVNDIIATVAEPVSTPTVLPTITESTETPQTSTAATPATTNSTIEVTQERERSGPSLSSILNTIKSNEQKQQAIAMAAVADSNQLALSVTDKAEKLALSIASAASSNTTLSTLDVGSPVTFVSSQLKNFTPLNITSSNANNGSIYALKPETRIIDNVSENQSLMDESKPIQLKPPAQIFTNNQSIENINSYNIAFGRRGDPIQDYIETNNQFFAETKTETRQSTVRQNVQDNDLAGGSRIERMAVIPNGFSVYTQFMLTNISFYEPKEIYKNVVIRDNVRTMYFIEKGNTDTYNKMIESQYK